MSIRLWHLLVLAVALMVGGWFFLPRHDGKGAPTAATATTSSVLPAADATPAPGKASNPTTTARPVTTTTAARPSSSPRLAAAIAPTAVTAARPTAAAAPTTTSPPTTAPPATTVAAVAVTPFPAACSISLGTAKKSPGGGAFFSITYTKPDRSGVLRAALERPDGSRTSLVTVPAQRVFDDRGESGKGTAEIKIPADAEPGSSWSVLAFVASNSPTCSASFTVA